MSDQPKPHHCKIDYDPDTDQVIFTVTEDANQPKPATGESRRLMTQVTHTDKHGDVSVHYEPVNPASEWTAKSVFTLYGHPNNPDGWQAVADAHNAALADKTKAFMEYSENGTTIIKDLREQLAAEREKVQTLTDALTWMDGSVLVNPKNWIRAEDNPGFHRHE